MRRPNAGMNVDGLARHVAPIDAALGRGRWHANKRVWWPRGGREAPRVWYHRRQTFEAIRERGNKLLEMAPGLAVASFFAGVVLALALRIMYGLVQRSQGYMRGARFFLMNVVLLLAFIVPAIPGITYGMEHAGAQFMGISVFAWNFISIAVSLVLNFACTVVFRGEEIMREIEQELDDWDDEE